MDYNYHFATISVLSYEQRDKNMDRIFYLTDKIKKVNIKFISESNSKKVEDIEGLQSIKNMYVKMYESEIKKLNKENKQIDLQILNKWRISNGYEPKYKDSNGNLINCKGI